MLVEAGVNAPDDPEVWYLHAIVCQMSGAHEDAESSIQKALKLNQNNPEAWYVLGSALLEQKKTEEAVEAYQQAIKLNPDHDKAQSNLGVCYKRLKQFDRARHSLEKAIRIDPSSAPSYSNLGDVLIELGQCEDAVETYNKAISSNPNYFIAYNNLAKVLIDIERYHEAEEILTRAIGIQPNIAEFYSNMGILMKNTYRYSEAINHLTKALQLKPDLVSARYNLGLVCLDVGFNEEAEQNFIAAIGLDAGYTRAHMALARAYKNTGAYGKALDVLEAVITDNQNESKLDSLRAEILIASGESEEAKILLEKVLSSYPAEPDLVRLSLKVAEEGVEVNRQLGLLEELLSTPSSSTKLNDRVLIHFDIARKYDELGDYDMAFDHYRSGNELKNIDYDLKEMSDFVDYLINHFDSGFFKRKYSGSNPIDVPVFIVGMPRSGTSLVEQILASHPLVCGAGELHDINNMTTTLFGEVSANGSAAFDAEILSSKKAAHLATGYINKLANISDSAMRVTDKMPHNFKHLWLIASLFPGARIIHVKRNPIDTCLSCYFKNFVGMHAYTNKLEDLADYYLQYQRLMEHWQSVLPTKIYEVEYESLVENQEEVSRLLIDHVGLEWDDVCLNFHENRRIVLTASQDQVRKPIYRKSIERWRHYEQYLAPLMEAFGDK